MIHKVQSTEQTLCSTTCTAPDKLSVPLFHPAGTKNNLFFHIYLKQLFLLHSYPP